MASTLRRRLCGVGGNSEDSTELVRVAVWDDEAIPPFMREAMSESGLAFPDFV